MRKVMIVFSCLFVSLMLYGCNPNWFGFWYHSMYPNSMNPNDFLNASEPVQELAINVDTDRYEYDTGDTLFAVIRLKNITNQTVSRSVYIGVLLPDQLTIAFVDPLLQVQSGRMDNVGTWIPKVSNKTLQPGEEVQYTIEYLWQGFETWGPYKAFAVTTETNALSDGVLNVGDIREGATWNLNFQVKF